MTHSPAIVICLEAMVPGLRPTTTSPISRVKSAFRAAVERRRTRYNQAKLLAASDRLYSDMGCSREDIARAMLGCK